MAGLIEMKNVSFAAEDRLIIQNFSHIFEEGNATALVGPSGCGKSTILKLSAGLLVPKEGEVFYRGRDVFAMNRQENLDFRREASMVFQDSALWANQSLQQILELPLRIHYPKMPQKERNIRIREVLDEVGYNRDLNIRPSQLSMGEQKLIGFARAIMCWPNMLFLDEWTESLDENSANRLIKLTLRHLKDRGTVIFVCHDIDIVKQVADHIVLIRGGQHFNKFSLEQIEKNEDLAKYIERGIAS